MIEIGNSLLKMSEDIDKVIKDIDYKFIGN